MLNRGFDFKYCSNPGAIEMTIVKSPTMPLRGAGGGILGHTIDRCIRRVTLEHVVIRPVSQFKVSPV